jgi:hypothetical protein
MSKPRTVHHALLISWLLVIQLAAACGQPPVDPPPNARTPGTVATTGRPDRITGDSLRLPRRPGSIRFAVIGDAGRGNKAQADVGREMAAVHELFDFDFVLMAGDNIYEGPATAADYRRKFEEPYAALLERGVTFHAVLGNHDDPLQRFYRPFNMGGRRYYTFKPDVGPLASIVTRGVRFFALDSTSLDREQLAWLDRELGQSSSEWKICFLHHPLYSAGRYGFPARLMRIVLEPIFVRHGVTVVFSGHEHFYLRTKPQRGVHYFISGAAGALRPGDIRYSSIVASGFDKDCHFLLIEIAGDELHFQAISRTGETVDHGVIRRRQEGEYGGTSIAPRLVQRIVEPDETGLERGRRDDDVRVVVRARNERHRASGAPAPGRLHAARD